LCVVVTHVLATSRDSAVTKVSERRLVEKLHVLSFFWCCTSNKIVEYVEIPLARRGTSYTVAFEIVIEGLNAAQAPTLGELKFRVFAKAGCIRVEKCASVSKRLKNKLGRRNLMRELGPFFAGIADTQFEKGLDREPTTLRFPTPRLTTIKRRIKSDRANARATTGGGEGVPTSK
jgi:hypothetical protein